MRIFNVVFILVFVLSAALQYNDPDPYVWMPLYLYGAFLCYRALEKKYHPAPYITGLILYSGYAVFLLFDKDGVISWISDHNAENIVQTMKATKPWIEETREFGGLLMLIVAVAGNVVWLGKRNKGQPVAG